MDERPSAPAHDFPLRSVEDIEAELSVRSPLLTRFAALCARPRLTNAQRRPLELLTSATREEQLTMAVLVRRAHAEAAGQEAAHAGSDRTPHRPPAAPPGDGAQVAFWEEEEEPVLPLSPPPESDDDGAVEEPPIDSLVAEREFESA